MTYNVFGGTLNLAQSIRVTCLPFSYKLTYVVIISVNGWH